MDREKCGTYIRCNSIKSEKKKEILSYVAMWMNLEDIMLNEINQSEKCKYAWFYVYEVSNIVLLSEARSGMVVCRMGKECGGRGVWIGGERNKLLFSAYKVLVMQDE